MTMGWIGDDAAKMLADEDTLAGAHRPDPAAAVHVAGHRRPRQRGPGPPHRLEAGDPAAGRVGDLRGALSGARRPPDVTVGRPPYLPPRRGGGRGAAGHP